MEELDQRQCLTQKRSTVGSGICCPFRFGDGSLIIPYSVIERMDRRYSPVNVEIELQSDDH